jgi:zinc protease
MMFEGSEHIARGQHFKIITESGGRENGNTSRDNTVYWDLVPSNQLETAIWLESDRMGFFLDSITQLKLDNQRNVVKNERGQNYDNKTFGTINEKISEALYPPSHPYSWLTIGYPSDLDRMTIKDVKDFFIRWYSPNNATLTIAGDVNSQDVLLLVEKYFSAIPKGPVITNQQFDPVVLEKNRYISYNEKIRISKVIFTFPTIPTRHPDEAPLDVLSEILGEGRTSVFNNYFIKNKKAESINVHHPCQELAGEFRIEIVTGNTYHLDKKLKKALAEFEKKGVTDDDLNKFKVRYESKQMEELESIESKGYRLAHNQTHTGNPNYIMNDFERYNKVTKEDIMRVYYKYIKDKFAVIISVLPNPDAIPVRFDNYTPKSRKTENEESDEYRNLVYTKTPETFDRTIQPSPGLPPIVTIPNIWKDSLSNGIRIIGTKTDELPMVFLRVNIEVGQMFDKPEQLGISSLLSNMLEESTTNASADEIDHKLNAMGSSIFINTTTKEINFYVSTLTRNIDSTLAILNDMLLHPKFDRTEFNKIKAKQLELINVGAYNPKTLPYKLFERILYGPNNVMANSSFGTVETVNSIWLKDLKTYYETNFVPSVTTITYVGNIDKDKLLAKLEFLKEWKGSTVVHHKCNVPSIEKTKIYFFDKPNATQSQIRIGYMGLPYDATGPFYKSIVATYALSTPFTSRINLNLREKHGYCYSASASFYGDKFPEAFILEADVKESKTDSALIEIMNEIKTYVDKGITKNELLFTQNSFIQNEALKFETPHQKLVFLKRILDNNLPFDYPRQQYEMFKKMSLDEINLQMINYLPYNHLNIVIIGNKEKVLSKLRLCKLGYEIQEVNYLGKPINR